MSGDDDLFAADDAATPLTPEERRDLIPTYVALRSELNEVERSMSPPANVGRFRASATC